MKLKNCVIGQRVEVKDQDGTGFYHSLRGQEGVIISIDPYDTDTRNIKVKFGDGRYDWGGAKGVRKVKGA